MLKKVNPWQTLLSTSAGTCTATAHNTWWRHQRVSKQPRNSSTLILGYSRTANKILAEWNWFCTNQVCTWICHTSVCLLAKHRNLENQVRKEQNYPAAVTVARKNEWKFNWSLFSFLTYTPEEHIKCIEEWLMLQADGVFFLHVNFRYWEVFSNKLPDTNSQDTGYDSQVTIFSTTSNADIAFLCTSDTTEQHYTIIWKVLPSCVTD